MASLKSAAIPGKLDAFKRDRKINIYSLKGLWTCLTEKKNTLKNQLRVPDDKSSSIVHLDVRCYYHTQTTTIDK